MRAPSLPQEVRVSEVCSYLHLVAPPSFFFVQDPWVYWISISELCVLPSNTKVIPLPPWWASYLCKWRSRVSSSAFSNATARLRSWRLQVTDLSSKMRRPRQNMAPISSSSRVPNCRPCHVNKAVHSDSTEGRPFHNGERDPRTHAYHRYWGLMVFLGHCLICFVVCCGWVVVSLCYADTQGFPEVPEFMTWQGAIGQKGGWDLDITSPTAVKAAALLPIFLKDFTAETSV